MPTFIMWSKYFLLYANFQGSLLLLWMRLNPCPWGKEYALNDVESSMIDGVRFTFLVLTVSSRISATRTSTRPTAGISRNTW